VQAVQNEQQNSTDITDVFQDSENLEEFLISLGHLPPSRHMPYRHRLTGSLWRPQQTVETLDVLKLHWRDQLCGSTLYRPWWHPPYSVYDWSWLRTAWFRNAVMIP